MTTGLSAIELTLAIVLVALSTLLTRSGILLLNERVQLSHRVDIALRFAPVCALTALIVPEVLLPSGALDVSLGNPRLPATIAASLFLLWRPSVGGAIAVGMIAYALVAFS